MPRGDGPVVRLLLAVVAAVLLAGLTAPAAAADPGPGSGDTITIPAPAGERGTPTAKQKAKALQAARLAAGRAICAPISGILPDSAKRGCAEKAGGAFAVGKRVGPEAACVGVLRALAVVPGVKSACVHAVRAVVGAAFHTFQKVYDQTLAHLVNGVKKVITVAKFIAHPEGAVDEFANTVKKDATSFTAAFLQHSTEATSAELTASWWRDQYAMAEVLGLAVMALLALMMCWQASTGRIDADTFFSSLFQHAPAGVLLMIFAPGIGWVIQQATTALAGGAARSTGNQIGTFSGNVMELVAATTAVHYPGGALAGALIFGLMFLGAVSTFFGFIVQHWTMTATAVVLAVAWGMWIHPTWRRKTRKMLAFWGAAALMKPAIIFLLGVAFAFINHQPLGRSGWDLLVSTATIAVVLLTVGLAPWGLLKHMPLLPNGNEHASSGGGHMGEALVGGGAGALSGAMLQRSRADHSGPSTGMTSASPAPPASRDNPAHPGGSGTGQTGGWRGRSSGAPAPAPPPGRPPGSAGPRSTGSGSTGSGSTGSGSVSRSGAGYKDPQGGGVNAAKTGRTAGGGGSTGGSAAQTARGGAGGGGAAGAGAGGGAAAAGGGGAAAAGPAGAAVFAAQLGSATLQAALAKSRQVANEAHPQMRDGDD